MWKQKHMFGFFLGLIVMLPGLTLADEMKPAVDACVSAVKAKSVNGADYQPGVDAHGKPVASADLGGGYNIKPPEVIEFSVEIDLAERLGFATRGPYEAKQKVATVRVDGDRITVNGQEIHTEETAALIAACRKQAR